MKFDVKWPIDPEIYIEHLILCRTRCHCASILRETPQGEGVQSAITSCNCSWNLCWSHSLLSLHRSLCLFANVLYVMRNRRFMWYTLRTLNCLRFENRRSIHLSTMFDSRVLFERKQCKIDAKNFATLFIPELLWCSIVFGIETFLYRIIHVKMIRNNKYLTLIEFIKNINEFTALNR